MTNQRADLRCSFSATESAGETSHALTVFYDGACPLCTAEIGFYRRRRGADRVGWVDVSTCPTENVTTGLTRDQALERFHVQDADGRLITGGQAFVVLDRPSRVLLDRPAVSPEATRLDDRPRLRQVPEMASEAAGDGQAQPELEVIFCRRIHPKAQYVRKQTYKPKKCCLTTAQMQQRFHDDTAHD